MIVTNYPSLPPVSDEDATAYMKGYRDSQEGGSRSRTRSGLDAYRARLIANGYATEPTAPALVVLPTVDEIAEAIVTDCLKGGPVTGEGWHVTAARAVLDLLEPRVPHWVKIEPGEIKPGMRVHYVTGDDGVEGTFTIESVERERLFFNGGYVWVEVSAPRTWYVDPRTPEDPGLIAARKLLAHFGVTMDDRAIAEAIKDIPMYAPRADA